MPAASSFCARVAVWVEMRSRQTAQPPAVAWPLNFHQILQRDGNAVQGPQALAGLDRLVRGLGRLPRLGFMNMYKSLQFRFQHRDARQACLHHDRPAKNDGPLSLPTGRAGSMRKDRSSCVHHQRKGLLFNHAIDAFGNDNLRSVGRWRRMDAGPVSDFFATSGRIRCC